MGDSFREMFCLSSWELYLEYSVYSLVILFPWLLQYNLKLTGIRGFHNGAEVVNACFTYFSSMFMILHPF